MHNAVHCLIAVAVRGGIGKVIVVFQAGRTNALPGGQGIHGGFGINGMCSGIVAGVMALGLLCEEEELKLKRILFLLRVQNRFGSLDCCTLSALGADCSGVLEEIGGILQEVIEE